MKQRKRRTIGRGMMIVEITFTVALCIFMSVEMLMLIKGSMYASFDAHIKDVLTHIERTTDMDDLYECVQTGVPSEKYNALQQKLNRMVDEFELIYIYVSIPTHLDNGKDVMVNVVASTSEAERAEGVEDYAIGYYGEDYYTEDQLTPYFKAWNNPGSFSTFTEKEEYFESAYIVAKPLVGPDGKVFALLCADMSLDMMHHTVNNYIWASVVLILLICIAFSVCVGTWLSRNVSKPLSALEKSAHDFADKSHGRKGAAELTYIPPDLHTENEIQSLSDAITQMSKDMKDYIEDILSAEKRAESAEEEVEDITRIAYEDVLTKVKSKVAYDAKKAELAKTIAEGNAKFAYVMIDLNNLKRINDTYGLENGDKYIVSASKIISGVYGDVPVYRIGGDEFAVILEDSAYYERDELIEVLDERFRLARDNAELEPWERCSAASGMTEFSPDADMDVDQVYRRAEKIMLRNKRMMKNDMG